MEDEMAFRSEAYWERWLSRNHSRSKGIWMRMYKKGSGVNALKGSEALDVALCYGWITGQARKGDEKFALWRFCPRRPRSLWSKINVGHAERLIKEGRMRAAGLREIESARLDGRWERAYHPQKTAVLPADLIKAVSANAKARAFLEGLGKSNRYAIIFRIDTTTSAEKRKRKIAQMVKMLEEGRTFH